jgi:hypothetical protein
MKMLLAIAAAGMVVAAAVTFQDAARSPSEVNLAAVTIDTDPPPRSLLCSEAKAELRLASTGPTSDFLDEFFLVTDPRKLCRNDEIAAMGGFEDASGRCYTLRAIGTGQPDLPMVCGERIKQGEDGQTIRELHCSGWSRELETDGAGGFRYTAATATGTGPARVSEGRCTPL